MNPMWTLDDIRPLNPIEPKQDVSFLDHLLQICATTESLLGHAAEALEEAPPATVLACAQLPFAVHDRELQVRVPSRHEGVTLNVQSLPIKVTITSAGALTHIGDDEAATGPAETALITQINVTVRLWDKRLELHKAYTNCVTPWGLRNDVIGKVYASMRLAEAQMASPNRRRAPLTAQMYQAEVARRIQEEVVHASSLLLQACGVINLEELPRLRQIYGYFLMIAPGRIACAEQPVPILSGLISTRATNPSPTPSEQQVSRLARPGAVRDDRILRQLMSMHRLLQQGEPELALVGCATATEWFLNQAFPTVARRTKKGYVRSGSISDFIAAGVLQFLTNEQRNVLGELCDKRNRVVHGAPPARTSIPGSNGSATGINPDFVKRALYDALGVYRSVNIHAGRNGASPAERVE
jgi:hypothetical protein